MTCGLFEAFEREANTVVLLNAAGEVTEAGFNLFVLSEGRLWTPASGVLLGITRDTVMESPARRQGITTEVTMFGPERLARAEEILITSTAGGVMPVTRLDGKAVGDGRPGETTLALRQAYWDAHDDPRWTTRVPT